MTLCHEAGIGSSLRRSSSASARSSPRLLLLAHAMRTFAVRPLVEWDGWAIWAMKARALYDFGGVATACSRRSRTGRSSTRCSCRRSRRPGFRAMDAFDGTLIHVQLALLAFGFAAALWTLLRERVPAALAGAAILAIVAADSMLRQLAGNLADIPLAFFVALGVVALARMLLDADAALLPFAAVMLGAATLTKPEGLLFAAAALVPFVAIAAHARRGLDRGRRRADPAAVAHLHRRARAEEPGVQPRRRRQSRVPRRPFRRAPAPRSGASGTRSGRAAGAGSSRSR